MIAGEIRNIDSSDLSPDSTRRRDFSWRARLVRADRIEAHRRGGSLPHVLSLRLRRLRLSRVVLLGRLFGDGLDGAFDRVTNQLLSSVIDLDYINAPCQDGGIDHVVYQELADEDTVFWSICIELGQSQIVHVDAIADGEARVFVLDFSQPAFPSDWQLRRRCIDALRIITERIVEGDSSPTDPSTISVRSGLLRRMKSASRDCLRTPGASGKAPRID